MNENHKIKDFFRKYGMEYEEINFEEQYQIFLNEMERGLEGHDSSLAMLPTYIDAQEEFSLNEPVLALDAGGTNLRVAFIHFNNDRQPIIRDFQTYPMPGTYGKMSKNEFFHALGDCLEPCIDECSQIGFCFSYPMEMMPNRDGRLIQFTKEVEAREIEGELIGENLLKILKERGHKESKKIVLLNDTVATLLAGKATSHNRLYDSFIGFILGTGTNACYIEENLKINKVPCLDPGKSMIINVELGNYDQAPRGQLDVEFDQRLQNPGYYIFEKMISGAYIGKLVLTVLRKAGEEGIFSTAFKVQLNQVNDLSTKDLNDFLHYPPTKGNPLTLCNKVGNQQDRTCLYWIIEGLIERAGYFTALHLTALISKTGKGLDPCRPVCVTVDGTTFFTLKGLRSSTEYYLKKHLCDQMGLCYEFNHVEHASLVGAAIAGLLNG